MDALITGESERVGLSVLDNEGVEHLIEMDETGSIEYHDQDGYPDRASRRTPAGNEHVAQARRFARYHVSVERGYDTVSPPVHPERIDALRASLASLSPEACLAAFGDLYRQLASHHGDGPRPVSLPSAADPGSVLYRVDVSLGRESAGTSLADRLTPLPDAYGFDLADLVTGGDSPSPPAPDIGGWPTVVEAGERTVETTGHPVAAVSDVAVAYLDDDGRERLAATDGGESGADVRVELPPVDPGSPAEFRASLAFTLRCQVRDCFARMGLSPPEPFRVRGYGRYEAAERYDAVDFYPRYHDVDADGPSG